ncbi:3-oxoacyl-(Acyl-carrier-protein) reductase [Novosphingobium resinovorum]|uniref:3-oxoacyl-(Acyl-carrier-protein) reductase n=2 Tax=Novosphingobium resinovorum TaxID=158500 RepID=A0A031JQZ2_9SPHN|nr:3-oxoacyl-(Acyl-carrier-protein) reductase [Novosphingobium resinovorum]
MGLLDGKVALVTGSGRGIGREIALQMAAAGAKVLVNDVGATLDGQGSDEGPGQEVVNAIRASGGQAELNSGSVADADAARAMVAQAIDSFGQLDIVVNNAGILRDVIFHRMTDDDWDAVVKVHLYGSFNVSRAAATHFRERSTGTFVHMTSTSGLIGGTGQANYMAAKLGIVGLSKSIAIDMKRFGVRSNCISPFAWSRMIGSIPETPEQEERLKSLQSLTPDKIAVAAVWLGSGATREINGQIFAVRKNEIFLMTQHRPMRSVHRDGGWTAEALVEQALPAFKPSLVPLDVTTDVFSWAPI